MFALQSVKKINVCLPGTIMRTLVACSRKLGWSRHVVSRAFPLNVAVLFGFPKKSESRCRPLNRIDTYVPLSALRTPFSRRDHGNGEAVLMGHLGNSTRRRVVDHHARSVIRSTPRRGSAFLHDPSIAGSEDNDKI